jgi:hypothetical protein
LRRTNSLQRWLSRQGPPGCGVIENQALGATVDSRHKRSATLERDGPSPFTVNYNWRRGNRGLRLIDLQELDKGSCHISVLELHPVMVMSHGGRVMSSVCVRTLNLCRSDLITNLSVPTLIYNPQCIRHVLQQASYCAVTHLNATCTSSPLELSILCTGPPRMDCPPLPLTTSSQHWSEGGHVLPKSLNW